MKQVLLIPLFFALLFVGCGAEQPDDAGAAAEGEAAAAEEAHMEGSATESAGATRGSAQATVNGANVTVDYGRPALQGRDMKAQADVGFVWRLGMNEATTLETNQDLKFGGTTVPAGKYTIFARKTGAEEWHLVFNSELGQWGAFKHDPSQDVAEVPLQVSTAAESAEVLTINVNETGQNSGEIVIIWGTDQLEADFTV
ncbi:MAG: DUF2911 domain-containing protein [Acidobacteriota bacterium]